jgi:hypothetical protein
MAVESETVSKVSPVQIPVSGVLAPLEPPLEPATFDFTVSSLTVKNPRSLFDDTDFANLAISVLAADNTVIKQYGPIAQSLGNLGKGLSINPKMSLTGIAVPDGGSIAISYVVVNKGGWDWDSKAIDAMGLAGSAVLGALAQGTIAGATVVTQAATATTAAVTTSTASVALPYVIAVGAAIIAVLEGLSILFADCDGTVVTGAMTIGKTELLQYAATGSWQIIIDYPGTDSADGCGANSDYSVTYGIEATPQAVVVPKVTVPNIVGMSVANGLVALRKVGLVGIEKVIVADVASPSNIVGQTPAAGAQVAANSEVQYEVKQRPVIIQKPGDPDPAA